MRGAEITRKFDEIVDFSDVEQFLDTPVKRYSSGMYVRLAFAVAAHLEPEILIVDEVLAVGDAAFQKKCLGKMGDVARQGRTVLFVSHNMAAIQNLCTTGVVLAGGGVVYKGSALEASEHYLSMVTSREFGLVQLDSHPGRTDYSRPVVKSIGLLGPDSTYRNSVKVGEDVMFELRYDTGALDLDNAVLGIHSTMGERVCTVGARFSRSFTFHLRGQGTLICRLRGMNLTPGEYKVMVAMGRRINPQDVDAIEDALTFTVEPADAFGTGETLLPGQGHFVVQSEWEMIETRQPAGSLVS